MMIIPQMIVFEYQKIIVHLEVDKSKGLGLEELWKYLLDTLIP